VTEKYLNITARQITNFGDREPNNLMLDLFPAQAIQCRASLPEIHFSTEEKDDGCDGRTPKPGTPDAWLGDTDTLLAV
jgi:hypothetical protein